MGVVKGGFGRVLEVVFDDGLDAVDHVAGAEYCLCISEQSVRCDERPGSGMSSLLTHH